MMPLKTFDEFLKIGVARKANSDALRAASLIEESERRKKFLGHILGKIEVSNENANYFIENSYDILISLIRAKVILDGFRCSGEGAHEAEIAYLRKFGLPESEIRFMNDLRYHRNGIKYYGKSFEKDYAMKVITFMEKAYPKLKRIAKSSQ